MSDNVQSRSEPESVPIDVTTCSTVLFSHHLIIICPKFLLKGNKP